MNPIHLQQAIFHVTRHICPELFLHNSPENDVFFCQIHYYADFCFELNLMNNVCSYMHNGEKKISSVSMNNLD